MNPPVLLLEQHFLKRLHIDWKAPSSEPMSPVATTRCSFDYEVAVHRTEPLRRMLTFRLQAQQLDHEQQAVAHKVDCEIVGLFSLTSATPAGREEEILRINGVSILYGILRGVFLTTTGAFPGGGFLLPSVMPQDIVRQVEEKRVHPAPEQAPGAKADTAPVNPGQP